ncbi:glucose-1-phosphate adenylyltransferase family protein [Micrococcus luteus]|uniref:glucose-1-phosphate adenylyltransferase family protein n=1 Tax=Micrococcus luteus TaxID=1270 RepID=UPI0024B0ACC3|nr:sugar phosphate nucleotidyltransferase [Micrococcus luteus]
MADPFPKDPEGAVVALVLAGGTGGRLMPLTAARAKPMVPLAGQYRLIDVVLSNLAHSRLRDVWVVEQYRPFTLNQHLAGGRPWDLDGTRHGLRLLPPAQGRAEEGFARGNGHAIAQQLPLLEQFGAETVVVLSADHLYQLDLRPVLAEHARSGAELTVVTTETDEDPSRFGVVQVDDDGAVTDYAYKPEDPAGTLVATEVFVFDVAALSGVVGDLVAGEDETATKDEGETDEDGDPVGSSLGDYGESIIPAFVARGRVREHRLVGYWRDIGTLDAYVRAHREILEGTGLDVAAEGWPLITNPHQAPPAWVAPDARVSGSLLNPGCRIEGEVSDSVVGPGVVVAAGATVRGSLLLGDCEVPAGAVLDTVVVDVGGAVPAHEVTGARRAGRGGRGAHPAGPRPGRGRDHRLRPARPVGLNGAGRTQPRRAGRMDPWPSPLPSSPRATASTPRACACPPPAGPPRRTTCSTGSVTWTRTASARASPAARSWRRTAPH